MAKAGCDSLEVGQFERLALCVEGFRFQMVAGNESQEVLGEVCVVVKSRVRLV